MKCGGSGKLRSLYANAYLGDCSGCEDCTPVACSECAGTGYEYQNMKHPPMIPCRKCGTEEEDDADTSG